MQQSQRTPNSILRKRANKENEPREGGKRNKLRSRRVSFAPDDELETMHLYQKGDRSSHHSGEDDDMPATEDLAARIPLEPAMQQQGSRMHGNGVGNQMAAHAGAANSMLLPMSPMAPSPLSSMDLTNNSMDLGFMQQHQGVEGLRLRPAVGLPAYDFTTNITSAVPALSTLVEEDEEQQEESSQADPPPPPPYHLHQQHHQSGGVQQHQQRRGSGGGGGMIAGQDMTVSMDLGGMTPSAHQAFGSNADGSPVDGFLSPMRAPAPRPGSHDPLALTPTSPYALHQMQQHAPGWPGAAAAGQEGELSEDLKDKWGFTPGVDDTMEMDRGRQVMGETTYNHVYGTSSTLGDITQAMQAGQIAGARPVIPNRSAIAATANAASFGGALPTGTITRLAAAAAAADPASTGAAGSGGGAAALQPGMRGSSGTSGGGLSARAPLSMHQTPVQAEMTINLLAEDGPAGMWQQPLGALTGHASVASNKPMRSLHGTNDPSGPELGTTTALLTGAHSVAGIGGAGVGHAVAPAGGALGGGTVGTRTMNGFTAQLLADGTTGSSSQLQAFMQRVQQQQPAGQQVARAAGNPAAPAAYHRDDLTSASSIGLMAGAAQAMQDGTSGSLDFNLAVAHNHPGGLFEDTGHSLGDFAPPPDLQATPSLQHNHLNLFAPPPAFPPTHNGYDDNNHSGGAAVRAPAAAGTGRSALGALPPLPPGQAPSRAAVLAAAAVPLPSGSPPAGARAGGGSQAGSAGAAGATEAPMAYAGPPMSFQDFLGLMEIRFLDDMRRRSSLVQPAYGMSLLAPPAALMGGNGPALPYGEALEVALVGGTQAQVTARLLEGLAEGVEGTQRRAVQAEAGLARNNPTLFRQAQAANIDTLESLREDMRALKRSCRQRTLLGWKKTRISQEQAVVGALRDSATLLDRHLEGIKSVLDQGVSLEQSLEDATALAAQRTLQIQEQIKAHHHAHEHDTLMSLRAAEVAAANERREALRDQLEEQHAEVQEQVKATADHKAALLQQLQQLQEQASQRPPPPARTTPLGVKAGAAARLAAAGRGAQARNALELQLSMQALQLDLRPLSDPTSTGALTISTGARISSQPLDLDTSCHWSLVVHKQFRLTVTSTNSSSQQGSQQGNQQSSQLGSQQQGEGGAAPAGGSDAAVGVVVSVEALPGAAQLAQELLRACLGDLVIPTEVPRTQALTRIQQALASLHALHRLTCDLNAALLACGPLKRVTLRPRDATAATVSETADGTGQQLVLTFLRPGSLGSRGAGIAEMVGRPARQVEVAVTCGEGLLDAGAGGLVAGGVAVRAWAPLGVMRPAAAAQVAEGLLQRAAAPGSGGAQLWQRLCSTVVGLMEEEAVWQQEAVEAAAVAAGVVAAAGSGCGSGSEVPGVPLPTLITNPLFA